ncbi:MAG TPA: tRNA (N6-threonylcarbamoyladenosine(37)-N6)-methyltransferase TrmO [Gammaproteobacteria bacterium]|nr:tRNA (N6-threonylcarbamoyladenosine(37)-N6)-methyltransferase TrmO [Gammaproteobacteria bacterium]
MECRRIGTVEAPPGETPRHWSASDVEGRLLIDEAYRPGLEGIEAGQRIVVLFAFDRSPAFGPEHLRVTPPTATEPRGLFSTCSPVRPNPIGLSVLEVLEVGAGWLRVRGLDMYDGTPVLDIKPHFPAATG